MTLGLFVLPAIVFIVGLVLADGNKSNIFTVVAVVGCLPAAARRRRFYHDGYAKSQWTKQCTMPLRQKKRKTADGI